MFEKRSRIYTVQTVKLLTYRFTAFHLSAVDSLAVSCWFCLYYVFFSAFTLAFGTCSITLFVFIRRCAKYLVRQTKSKRKIENKSEKGAPCKWIQFIRCFVFEFFFLFLCCWDFDSAMHDRKPPSVRENNLKMNYSILYLVAYHSEIHQINNTQSARAREWEGDMDADGSSSVSLVFLCIAWKRPK